jgi:hypothetical protein
LLVVLLIFNIQTFLTTFRKILRPEEVVVVVQVVVVKGSRANLRNRAENCRGRKTTFTKATFEALVVSQLLGAPTTMRVLVGECPTGLTSNGQLVKNLDAGSKGEELSTTSEPGLFSACHCFTSSKRGTSKIPPG